MSANEQMGAGEGLGFVPYTRPTGTDNHNSFGSFDTRSGEMLTELFYFSGRTDKEGVVIR